MSIAISSEATRILREASWNVSRSINTQPIRDFLGQHGFCVSDIANDFLRHFHGLRIEPQNKGALSLINFDVYEEVAWLEENDKPFLDALTRAPLCPIGLGTMVWLFLTPAGEMIVLNDQWLHYTKLPSIAEGMDWLLGIRRSRHFASVQLNKEQVPPEFR